MNIPTPAYAIERAFASTGNSSNHGPVVTGVTILPAPSGAAPMLPVPLDQRQAFPALPLMSSTDKECFNTGATRGAHSSAGVVHVHSERQKTPGARQAPPAEKMTDSAPATHRSFAAHCCAANSVTPGAFAAGCGCLCNHLVSGLDSCAESIGYCVISICDGFFSAMGTCSDD